METFGNPGKESFSPGEKLFSVFQDSEGKYRAINGPEIIISAMDKKSFIQKLTWYLSSELD